MGKIVNTLSAVTFSIGTSFTVAQAQVSEKEWNSFDNNVKRHWTECCLEYFTGRPNQLFPHMDYKCNMTEVQARLGCPQSFFDKYRSAAGKPETEPETEEVIPQKQPRQEQRQRWAGCTSEAEVHQYAKEDVRELTRQLHDKLLEMGPLYEEFRKLQPGIYGQMTTSGLSQWLWSTPIGRGVDHVIEGLKRWTGKVMSDTINESISEGNPPEI